MLYQYLESRQQERCRKLVLVEPGWGIVFVHDPDNYVCVSFGCQPNKKGDNYYDKHFAGDILAKCIPRRSAIRDPNAEPVEWLGLMVQSVSGDPQSTGALVHRKQAGGLVVQDLKRQQRVHPCVRVRRLDD